MDKYEIFSANLLENNANKLCTKFGSPMMMETCRNHVPQKQQKRENSTIISQGGKWLIPKFSSKTR